MSADFTVKPVHAPAPTDFVRPAPVAAREGVATDVAPERSVTPADAALAARNDANLSGSVLSRRTEFDAKTNLLILRVIDTETGHVVKQIPSESAVKLRAYNRALVAGLSPNQADHYTTRANGPPLFPRFAGGGWVTGRGSGPTRNDRFQPCTWTAVGR